MENIKEPRENKRSKWKMYRNQGPEKEIMENVTKLRNKKEVNGECKGTKRQKKE